MDGVSPAAAVYFVCCVVLCPILLVNLTVAAAAFRVAQGSASLDRRTFGAHEGTPSADPSLARAGSIAGCRARCMARCLRPQCGPRWLHGVQYAVRRVVQHAYWRRFVLVSLTANALALAVPYYGMPADGVFVLDVLNVVFVVVLCVHAALLLGGLGPVLACLSAASLADCVLACLGLVELLVDWRGAYVFRALRMLRVARVLVALVSTRRLGGVLKVRPSLAPASSS